MLKSRALLLCANYYNISLNVQRPTFFNIYNLPFLRSPNIGKIKVKAGPKTDYFSYIPSSCTNRIAVFNNFFFTDIQPTKRQTKPCPRLCSFQIFFEQSTYNCFHVKYAFKACQVIAIKNDSNSLLGKTRARFCAAVCQKCVCKV